MPRGLYNWTFKDVTNYLKAKGFILGHIKGSHYFYEGIIDGIQRQVCVPCHASIIISPDTIQSIIKQSGIPKKNWINKK